MQPARLDALVRHLENAPVECDGMARLVATVLSQHKIPYTGMVGRITPKGCDYSIPHFWVQVEDLVIDYRAQMWLGMADGIPHGVVKASDYPDLYKGEPFQLNPLPKVLFDIMKMPFPASLRNGTLTSDGPS